MMIVDRRAEWHTRFYLRMKECPWVRMDANINMLMSHIAGGDWKVIAKALQNSERPNH